MVLQRCRSAGVFSFEFLFCVMKKCITGIEFCGQQVEINKYFDFRFNNFKASQYTIVFLAHLKDECLSGGSIIQNKLFHVCNL